MSIQKSIINESGVETAKKIRKALKAAFPSVKFSVRSDYNSVRINWVDACTVSEVEEITNKFESGYFDGMQDMYISGHYEYEGKLYNGAKYIFTSRDLSDEYRAILEAKAEQMGYIKEWNCFQVWQLNKAEQAIRAEQTTTPKESTTHETISTQSTQNNNDITITLNEEKNGIEVQFISKPSEAILESLRANGFKYYHKLNKKWIAKQTPERIAFSYSLIPSQSEQNEVSEVVEEVEQTQVKQPITFEVGQKYLDNENNIITITDIKQNKIIAGTEENTITYSKPRYDGKIINGWTMLENSVYAQSLTIIDNEPTQETIIDPVTEAKEQTQQIPIKSITILWSESSLVKDNTIVHSFKEAAEIIHSIALSDKSFAKTKFIIEWVDGRTHTGRIDVQSKDANKSNPIGEHVKYFYENLAGLRKPTSWTWEEHYNNLKAMYNIDNDGMEEMKQILNTYLLDDITPTPEPTKETVNDELTPIASAKKEVKYNNVVSLAERRQQKEQQQKENEAMKQLEQLFLSIMPHINDNERLQILNMANDTEKLFSYLMDLTIKYKLLTK